MQTRQPSTAAVEPKNEIVSRVSSTVMTVRITPLSLRRALQRQQAAMGAGRDMARDRIGGIDRERLGALAPAGACGSRWASTNRAIR